MALVVLGFLTLWLLVLVSGLGMAVEGISILTFAPWAFEFGPLVERGSIRGRISVERVLSLGSPEMKSRSEENGVVHFRSAFCLPYMVSPLFAKGTMNTRGAEVEYCARVTLFPTAFLSSGLLFFAVLQITRAAFDGGWLIDVGAVVVGVLVLAVILGSSYRAAERAIEIENYLQLVRSAVEANGECTGSSGCGGDPSAGG